MSERDQIACREVVELLSDYVDGAVSESDRRRLELHLGGCDGCAGALSQLRETIRLTGTLTEGDLPTALRDALRASFIAWQGGR